MLPFSKFIKNTSYVMLLLSSVFATTQVLAQATANGAGSTSVAGLVAAGDDGDVGTGRKLKAVYKGGMNQVAMTKEPRLDPIFEKCGNIQAAYSNLIPFNNKSNPKSLAKIRSLNTEQLKVISGVYLCVQKEIPALIVDILPLLVRGETELPITSLPFAKSVVEELIRNRVQNVYFAHEPVSPAAAGAVGVQKS
jgi:hypothetical protein